MPANLLVAFILPPGVFIREDSYIFQVPQALESTVSSWDGRLNPENQTKGFQPPSLPPTKDGQEQDGTSGHRA